MTRAKKNTHVVCITIAEASSILYNAEIPEDVFEKFNPKFEAEIARLEKLSGQIAVAIDNAEVKATKAEAKIEKKLEKIAALEAKIAALKAE